MGFIQFEGNTLQDIRWRELFSTPWRHDAPRGRPWGIRSGDNSSLNMTLPLASPRVGGYPHSWRGWWLFGPGDEEVVQRRSGDSGHLGHCALGDTEVERLPALVLPSVEP